MDGIFLKLFHLASPFLDTRENEEHTLIAYGFAERLVDAEGGDPQVVFPAIILHDVGWKSVPEDLQLNAYGPYATDMDLRRIHELEGARIAGEILDKVNYPFHLRKEIIDIVLDHDSTIEAVSANDAIVKDADKLWRYSLHGVTINRTRFDMSFPQYLVRLMNKIEEWFLTETGKNIAREQLHLREQGWKQRIEG